MSRQLCLQSCRVATANVITTCSVSDIIILITFQPEECFRLCSLIKVVLCDGAGLISDGVPEVDVGQSMGISVHVCQIP